jgi:hypothetical protein
MSFAQLADERLLESAKAHVGELQWNVEADGALRRATPSSVTAILSLMPRRGLQPAIITRLLDEYPPHPIERALIAWDVAHATLLGRNDADLAARLTTELAALKQIRSGGQGAAIPRDRIAALIEALRFPGHERLVDEYATLPNLGGLVAMTRAYRSLDSKPALVAVTLDHVRRLSFAHLPSLALAFAQILWDRFAVHAALDLMIEIALDFQQLDAVPEIEPRDDRQMQRKAYGLLRAHLAMHNIDAAVTVNDSLMRVPATRDSTDPSLLLARIEVALLANQRIDDVASDFVNAMAPAESGWRYAVQVRDSVTLRMRPETAPFIVASFVSRFGNSAEMWRRATRYLPARNSLLKRLSREIRYVSHDPEVWRALASFTTAGAAIETEVQQRLHAQHS